MSEQQNLLKEALKKELCEEDHLFFTRYFFKVRNGFKFKVNWHHYVLGAVVDSIIKGELKNVLINIAPGSSKTEVVVVNFIARGIALNPYSRFLHLTYSNTLASVNSQAARDIVQSEEFQKFWPCKISNDDSAKARWNIEIEGNKAGGCYAVPTGGQVTGFRAGRMVEGFQGAIIIDDPLKPEDSFSKPLTNEANRKLVTTIKSRKANPETPIVVIMQRISTTDTTQFIKDGNLDDQGPWEFISIPALIDEAWIEQNKKWLPKKVLDLIDGQEQDEEGRFSYWPYKEPLQTLLDMEKGISKTKEGNILSRFVFSSQYNQNPRPIGGNLIKGEYFKRYKVLPRIRARYVFCDTAQKTKEHNDFSVFQCWGLGEDNFIYLLDQIRGKWEAPELKKRAIAFWNKHKSVHHEYHLLGALRSMYVEDKSSGTGLIQDLRISERIPVIAVQRNVDKLTRVYDGLPYMEAGHVFIPDDSLDASYISDFITECEEFNADMTHAHDDQIDPMLDAIDNLLSNKNKLKFWENIK